MEADFFTAHQSYLRWKFQPFPAERTDTRRRRVCGWGCYRAIQIFRTFSSQNGRDRRPRNGPIYHYDHGKCPKREDDAISANHREGSKPERQYLHIKDDETRLERPPDCKRVTRRRMVGQRRGIASSTAPLSKMKSLVVG